MSSKFIKPLTLAVGAAFVGSFAVDASAASFSVTDLDAGYMQVGDPAKKGEEGKCGEGKCGEGKCGEDKKAAGAEGKCGEGKCGEHKAAEGKCGEGKCGEGKCGEDKKEGDKGAEGSCGGRG